MFFRSYNLPTLSIVLASILSFSVLADVNTPPGQGMDTIILKNANDVSSAVAELTTQLKRQRFTIPLIINHSAAAASVNLDLAPNQVIFARPPRFLERRLLRKSMTLGLDLPLKFLVYEDSDGEIKLSVNSLGYLIDRHDIKVRDFVLRVSNKLIEQFGTPDKERQGLISVKSSQSLEDTVQALQDAISVNPAARIPLVLNYRKYRRSSSVLVVFGNPNVGTPLMQADPRVGIDLPLKLLVWENENGEVNITYNDPRFLADRVDLEGQDNRLDAIANALKNIAMAGAGDNL